MRHLPLIGLAAAALSLAACNQAQTETAADATDMAGNEAMTPATDAAHTDAMMPAHEVAVPFTQAAFETAQRENRPILVDVYADWCPVCAQQQPAIDAAAADAANHGLVVFRLDFDDQKDEQTQFQVTRQSTLIAFRGANETGRLIGETDPQAIAALVASTRS